MCKTKVYDLIAIYKYCTEKFRSAINVCDFDRILKKGSVVRNYRNGQIDQYTLEQTEITVVH